MGRATARNMLIVTSALVLVCLLAYSLLQREGRSAHETVVTTAAARPVVPALSSDANVANDATPSHAAPRLPPNGTPWSATKRALFARAMRGDKPAADRLFRDTQTCGKALLAHNQLDALASVPRSGMTDAKIQEMQKLESGLRSSLEALGDICTQSDAAELARSVDQIALAAAQAGNKKAAACYLDASFHDLVGTPQDVEFERYSRFSGDLIGAALRQGNWDVVNVMALAYGSGKKSGLYAQLVQSDPIKEYAYVKLQQLGAVGSLREAKEEQLNLIPGSGHLSQDDVRRSNDWAQDMLAKYFREPLETDQPPDCFNSESGG